MLRKLEAEEFDTYVPMAYEISLKLANTSFPVYTDGVKTKEDFFRAAKTSMEREDEELLLFLENGAAEGVLSFFALADDRYLGVKFLSVRKHYAKALAELFAYWQENYRGYEWDVYFPEENTEALAYMNGCGRRAAEVNVVDVLLFDEYVPQSERGAVFPINRRNFAVFAELHRHYEADMYWTSERIRSSLDNWAIFALEGKGAVYYNGKGGADLEIFGVDFLDGRWEAETAEELLIACLNYAKRSGAKSMYFFNDPKMHEIAAALGFRRVTAAHLFSGSIVGSGD